MLGYICKATERKNKQTLAKSLCTCRSSRTAPMLHGIKQEAIAITTFEQLKLAITTYEQLKCIKTHPCGLFILSSIFFLAATPDRTIKDITSVEVKCSYASNDNVITHNNVHYHKNLFNGHFKVPLINHYFNKLDYRYDFLKFRMLHHYFLFIILLI
ncbi:hypothetical protein ACJMK2_002747 [Sinanodonta woodiana]|uniref:YqaJ viral recombinase domain-containing protein n=1 Tax=Sinanodonta woodiana TaxID=1069815 RepID=A0ABD3XW90_SINWO